MNKLPFKDGYYKTGEVKKSLLPSVYFYKKMALIVFRSSRMAKRGKYGNAGWSDSSLDIMKALESCGVRIEITGANNFQSLKEPCVFISNHMSTLETFVLPGIIEPFKDVTFVVKQSLIDYPVFKYVMRSRDPIVVGRINPRDDLKAVFEGGTERLNAGRSIIIFPQTTRTNDFDPEKFNTIGMKLAKRAGVPVIPIALKTDAWGNGKLIKDFGKIDPFKEVHFAFGEPMYVRDRGDEEHKKIIEYISANLKKWRN
jgi:1-acyl-sn-glycerol-3-phosphate acyltransferase